MIIAARCYSVAMHKWASTEPRGNLYSIAMMLTAIGFFAGMDTVLKLLSAQYPALQVAAMRGWVALPMVLLWIAWRGSWDKLRPQRWIWHIVRGVLAIVMLSLFTRGVRDLPLANAYTLFFIAPILITALAAPILGEQAQRAHWWAVAGGMVGVWVALKPSVQGFLHPSGLAVLGAAACYAVSALLARLSSRTDSNESLMLWIMVIVALGAGVLAAPDWQPVRAQDAALLLGLALTGFGGQLAITEAFRYGQASAVAPFEYSALAWGLGLDWLLWQTWPDGRTLAGAAIVMACGLWVIRHEHNQALRADAHP